MRHEHTFGACEGQLVHLGGIGSIRDFERRSRGGTGVIQRSSLSKSFRSSEIRIHTYESDGVLKLWGDRDFLFRLDDESVGGDLFAYLEERSPRPVRTRIIPDSFWSAECVSGASVCRPPAETVQEIPVRHDHRFGGCQGMLNITENTIIYVTDNPNDSRIWRLADVESFASTDDFDLARSRLETKLSISISKLPLNRETYQHIWNRVLRASDSDLPGGVSNETHSIQDWRCDAGGAGSGIRLSLPRCVSAIPFQGITCLGTERATADTAMVICQRQKGTRERSLIVGQGVIQEMYSPTSARSFSHTRRYPASWEP